MLALFLILRPAAGLLDLVWLLVLPLPAVLDWAHSRLSGWPGFNWLRSLTGALLGVSLARTVQLNMLEPGHWLVVLQLVSLTAIVVLVEGWARWRAFRSRARSGGAP